MSLKTHQAIAHISSFLIIITMFFLSSLVIDQGIFETQAGIELFFFIMTHVLIVNIQQAIGRQRSSWFTLIRNIACTSVSYILALMIDQYLIKTGIISLISKTTQLEDYAINHITFWGTPIILFFLVLTYRPKYVITPDNNKTYHLGTATEEKAHD